MNNYLFKVLLSDHTEFVPMEANGISEAREKFSEHMNSLQLSDEWCLVAVYRQI